MGLLDAWKSTVDTFSNYTEEIASDLYNYVNGVHKETTRRNIDDWNNNLLYTAPVIRQLNSSANYVSSGIDKLLNGIDAQKAMEKDNLMFLDSMHKKLGTIVDEQFSKVGIRDFMLGKGFEYNPKTSSEEDKNNFNAYMRVVSSLASGKSIDEAFSEYIDPKAAKEAFLGYFAEEDSENTWDNLRQGLLDNYSKFSYEDKQKSIQKIADRLDKDSNKELEANISGVLGRMTTESFKPHFKNSLADKRQVAFRSAFLDIVDSKDIDKILNWGDTGTGFLNAVMEAKTAGDIESIARRYTKVLASLNYSQSAFIGGMLNGYNSAISYYNTAGDVSLLSNKDNTFTYTKTDGKGKKIEKSTGIVYNIDGLINKYKNLIK